MDVHPDQGVEEPPADGGGPERSVDPTGFNRHLQTCLRLLQQERIVDWTMGKWFSANPELAMLLDLYLAERERREVYLWQVSNTITIPAATAHRKLMRLTDQGLIARKNIPADRRRIGLELTPCGRDAIEALLDRLAT